MLLKKTFWLTLICLILAYADLAGARWFILPGVYYTQELGWVGACTVISESNRKDRFEARFEYSGEDQGLAALSYFRPAHKVELTVNAEFQASEKYVYSNLYPSRQEELFASNRQFTNLYVRCDFPKTNGIFYGFETACRLYKFKGDIRAGEQPAEYSLIQLYYSEGEEYSLVLRSGLERRDNRDYSTVGQYLLWKLDLGKSFEGSQSYQLIRTQVDGRQYLQLWRDHTVLALNARGGLLHHQVPYFSQFKLGGVSNLRGFPEDRYYGNAFYLFRAEFRHIVLKDLVMPLPLVKQLYPTFSAGVVLFTDAGDLWRDNLGWWGFRQGIGAGLRVIFPPSIVAALDIAKPVDSGGFIFYLNLKQSF